MPPPGRGPDDGIGWGFLIGILILLVVGGIVAAVLLTRDHNKQNAQTTTTVLVRTGVTTTVPVTRTARTTTVTTATTSPVKTPPVTTSAGNATTTVTTTTAPTSSSPSGSTSSGSSSSGSSSSGSSSSGSSSSGSSSSGSSGPPSNVSVPDVGSSQAQSAVQQLNSAGLLVTLAYVPNDQPLGTVVAESPQAGTSAQTGSHVTLNLSAGPHSVGSAAVPTLTGQTIPQAVSATKQAGLRLIFVRKPVTDKAQAGKIVEQTPAPGTSVPKNGKVLVYMGAVR